MKTFFKYLLMQARSVESGSHGKQNILFEHFIGRSGHNTVRIISLVQDKAQIAGFPVQQNASVPQTDFPQPCVGTDIITDSSVRRAQYIFDIVEKRIFR